MEGNKIYFDFSATTPVDPRVLETMLPYFRGDFGNPSSIHTFGQQAETAIEDARTTIANILDCHPSEIIFTSGGTESNNLAIRGVALAARQLRGANHILITPVEHPAVLKPARQLADLFGFEVEYLPVDRFGLVDPGDVVKHIRLDTALVSVIYANNEIGTINPINEIGRICREKKPMAETDRKQASDSMISV